MGASSRARCLYAELRFQAWLDALQYPAATDKHTMDRQLCAKIEGLLLSGEGKSLRRAILHAASHFPRWSLCGV